MTDTPTGVLNGWTPKTPATSYRPVQVESAVEGLCGARLPNGKGLLTWPSGSNVRAAVLDSPSNWLANDVVTAPFTACSPGATVRRVACFAHGGQVYLTVLRGDDASFAVTVWKATDPNNPTSFTLQSTVDSGSLTGWGVPGSTLVAGIPHITPGGRWVLVGHSCEPEGGAAEFRSVRLWTANGPGGPWTTRVDYAYTSRTLYYLSGQLAPAPNGDLHFFSYQETGVASPRRILWRSTDAGVTWAQAATSVDVGGGWQSFLNNGSKLFSAQSSTFNVLRLDGAGTDFSHWVDTGEDWGSPGAGDDRATMKMVLTPDGVYSFHSDLVSKHGLIVGGWTIGRVAQGSGF